MKLWKSVVGKLWMTIIGLVALVLLINSLLIGRFIDSNFANTKDQEVSLQKLAVNIAKDTPEHLHNSTYIQVLNELLGAQDAAMIIVDPNLEETPISQMVSGMRKYRAADIFSKQQMEQALSGEIVHANILDEKTDQPYLAVAVPIALGTEQHSAVIVYQMQTTLEHTKSYFRKLFIYAAIIGFLLTTVFAFFLSTRITRPLLQMKKAADLIPKGDYQIRVPVSSTDEIGELAKTFNHMTGQLEKTIRDLNHEKEHLSSVLRSMTDAVITFDARGNVILANPKGEKIMEEWSEIQWNEPEMEDYTVYDRVPEPLQYLFQSAVEGTQEITSKIHVHKGVWSVIMAPLYTNETIRGAVAVLRDVTKEFRLEKLRTDFVANVSHELRTPISMLQGYSEALIDDIAGSPEERRELAQVIYDESLRMGRLVRDLLDLARMESGHIEMNFKEVDLAALLKRVHRKFSALCRENGIMLHLNLDSSNMELSHADEDRLEQVLTNLMDNAIRHTSREASIFIRAHSFMMHAKPAVLIQIEDQGMGIPKEDIPYIFERFYKADKARTRGNSAGTGLGLAIVKNIIEAHQGEVQVHSEYGQGTTFSIMLLKKTSAFSK